KSNNNKNNCADSVCTLMLAQVSVKVVDVNKNTFLLDEYYTVAQHNNDTLRPPTDASLYDSSYVVLDDGYVSKMYNKTYDFRFIGISNNKVVVDEPFTISADCCHINKVSGKSEIVVQ